MNPNKALWEKGDFTRIAESMRESGEALVRGLGITKGLKVLDLGCGDGTTALPAARLGADVLGVDIASDDIHPLHLHRHSFELRRIGGVPTAGVIKDVVMLGGFQEIEFDFVADNPGRTLFHCHQQLHMDFGFMALFDYA